MDFDLKIVTSQKVEDNCALIGQVSFFVSHLHFVYFVSNFADEILWIVVFKILVFTA